MMTVQDLIDQLMKIEDKNLPLVEFCGNYQPKKVDLFIEEKEYKGYNTTHRFAAVYLDD